MQGKSDVEAIENFRGDAFFKQALDIAVLPSSPTLRQRLDAQADGIAVHTGAMIETLLLGHRPDYGVLPCGWLPVDIDTFAMDNSGTAKEGVGRTYAGVDGFCPLAVYLGPYGFRQNARVFQHDISDTSKSTPRERRSDYERPSPAG